MMKFSVPPGYVRKKPPPKPKLDPFIPVIDRILADDKSRPKKQQHTAKRIFERLRDEHSFTGRRAGDDGKVRGNWQRIDPWVRQYTRDRLLAIGHRHDRTFEAALAANCA